MNSIRNAAVSLDTNVFVFALRKDTTYPACEILLFDKLSELQIYMLLQIFVELQHNLTSDEMRGVLRALLRAKAVMWDYAPAPMKLIARWEQQGAKKGEPSLLPTLRLRISALSFPRTALPLLLSARQPRMSDKRLLCFRHITIGGDWDERASRHIPAGRSENLRP